ncbi:MAG TPA: GNAT family N-acetyltransferase [Candidatus Baltobacteraceae bacterium]|nr:GNAT family N-acetyltransferase [Candidatus Baltobacteraceae bacterium]
MSLASGYSELPAGKIANVATYLEMRERAALLPERPEAARSLERLRPPPLDAYRSLFKRVGAPYLWFSRLTMTDEQLAAIIRDPDVEVYLVRDGGAEAGLLELDFRTLGECELVFFGLLEPYIGKGAGRWLMNRAIELAWSHPLRRFWLHTCTLDHPKALEFYRRSGFTPFKREIEIADDPRLVGILPRDAAPSIPLI